MRVALQLCDLSIISIIAIIWYSGTKSKDYKTNFFKYPLIASSFMVGSNIAFTLLSLQLFYTPQIILSLFAHANRITLFVTLYTICMYWLSKGTTKRRHQQIFPSLAAIPFLFILLSILIEMGSVYDIHSSPIPSGFSYISVYIIAAIVGIILILIIYRKYVSSWTRYIAIFNILLLILSILVHTFSPISGDIDTFVVSCLASAFLAIENPLNRYDNNYNCFKDEVIIPSIERYFDDEIDGFAILISMRTVRVTEDTEKEMFKYKHHIIRQIMTVPECEIFVTEQRNIFVLCYNKDIYDNFLLDVKDEITSYVNDHFNDLTVKTTMIKFPDIRSAKKPTLLYKYMNLENEYARDSYGFFVEKELDKNVIEYDISNETIEKSIVNAINNDKIEILYTSKYSKEIDGVDRCSARVCIVDDDGNLIESKDYIKVAERTGLVVELSYKVYEKVCRFLKNPELAKTGLKTVDVNLSYVILEQSGMADEYIRISKQYDIDPKMVDLLIHKGPDFSYEGPFVKNVQKLREFGFGITLAQFNSNASNLVDVIKMPITELGFEKSVIWNYYDSPIYRKTIDQIVNLCHQVGVRVTANGVDRQSQFNGIKIADFDYMKGAYFNKPMLENDFIFYLKPSIFDKKKS